MRVFLWFCSSGDKGMRKLPVILASIFLTGCATTQDQYKLPWEYEEQIERENRLKQDAYLNTWVGKSEQELLESEYWNNFQKWKNYGTKDGKKVIEYLLRRYKTIGGSTIQPVHTSGTIGTTPFQATSYIVDTSKPSETVDFPYVTRFLVGGDGKIEGWQDNVSVFDSDKFQDLNCINCVKFKSA
jgi:hypothetical protein